MRAQHAILPLVLLVLAGCASGYDVHGVRVTDEEMRKYQASWKPGALEVAATSGVDPGEHEGILNLIATLESRGVADMPPCEDLTLTEIVRSTVTHFQFGITGEKFGPLSMYEDWRVLACGSKHSWLALVGPPPRRELQVVRAFSRDGGWLELPVPQSRKEPD